MKNTTIKSTALCIAVLAASCFFLSGCFRKHIVSSPPIKRPAQRVAPASKPKVVVDSELTPEPKQPEIIEDTYIVDAPVDETANAPKVQEGTLDVEPQPASEEPIAKDSHEMEVIEKSVVVVEESPAITPMAEMYYVQVGAFGDMENANAVLADLIRQGYKGSKLEKTESGLYRVQAGAFTDEVAASEALSELQATFPKGFILKSQPVK